MAQISRIFRGLGTTNLISVETNSTNRIRDLLGDIQRLVEQYDRMWSVYRDDSVISTLNQCGTVKNVDRDTREIITRAIQLGKDTDGYFDITTLPLNKIWKQSITENVLPDMENVNKALRFVDYHDVRINDEEITLGYGQQIDLGGIAKGYILGQVSDLLIDNGIKKGIVNLGGSVRIIGTGEGVIRNPFLPLNNNNRASSIMTLGITDQYVVTSGSYEQEMIIGDNRYHHIIDPFTGYPSTSELKSATLIGGDPTMLDAYATAIFSMDLDNAMELLKRNNIELIAILHDGKIFATDIIKQHIKEVRNGKDSNKTNQG